MSDDDVCACGRPLHYTSPVVRAMVDTLIAEHGAEVRVEVDGRAWLVQRHYIALHGLKARELPSLADEYGFPGLA